MNSDNPTSPANACAHPHVFVGDASAAERGTRHVVWITLVMMVIEIAAGWTYNSMALLADGWHMSSHVVAIGVSVLAYAAARRYAGDARFAFGTWKIEILGGFASALFLLGVAAMMVFGSLERLLAPQPVHYPEALAVAVVGLVVNLVCALILNQAHGHEHVCSHDDDHQAHHTHGHGEDLNLKSAYLHVVADAATSVLAIFALVGGWWNGWSWLDPAMGIVGAALVAIWAKNLIIETGAILLDREMDHPLVDAIRRVVTESDPDGTTRVTDLHLWRVGRERYACALTVQSGRRGLTAQQVRESLAEHTRIVHSTIEIHHATKSQ